MSTLNRVLVLGAGRVGTMLANALEGEGRLAGWWTRSRDFEGPAAGRGCHDWPNQDLLTASSTIILCVADDAIERVAKALSTSKFEPGTVALHTSGVRGAEALSALEGVCSYGCWHPLHAVQAGDPLSTLRGAYFALDGDDLARERAAALSEWAGGVVGVVPSEARVAYHLAAVLAGNSIFSSLYAASKVARAAGIDSDELNNGLARLASQSLDAAITHGAEQAATGPAVRGDLATLQRHMRTPALDESTREFYRSAAKLLLELADSRPHQKEAREQTLRWLDQQKPRGL